MATRILQSEDSLESGDGASELPPSRRTTHRTPQDKALVASKPGFHNLKAAAYMFPLVAGDIMMAFMLSINLAPYLLGRLHLGVSKASNLVTYYSGTSYGLAVLGGFVADSYLGKFRTILISTIFTISGAIVLIVSVTLPSLKPDHCVPTAERACPEAGSKVMGTLYLGIYLIAVGSGGIKSSLSAFGADQFDGSSPEGAKQREKYFFYYFLAMQFGALVMETLVVYLQDQVNRAWGYSMPLLFFLLGIPVFLLGAPRYRHVAPAGSFLTRMVQVLAVAVANRKASVPSDSGELWEVRRPGGYSIITGVRNIPHTNSLRFLDKAATIRNDEIAPDAKAMDPWKRCTVTQVEETKRILRLIPLWLSSSVSYLVFAQLLSFTVLVASTYDRTWGDHFELPPASTITFASIAAFAVVPFYLYCVVPVARRLTKNPSGLTPLQRIGGGLIAGILACLIASAVEKKRVHEMRALSLENAPIGTFVLPLSIFYLLPQFVMAMVSDVLLMVGQFDFFYGENSDGVRTIGTSLAFVSVALGFYISTGLVDSVNSVTRRHGGSWLDAKVNDGGLQKFWYFLIVLLSANFCLYVFLARRYKYNSSSFGEMAEHERTETAQERQIGSPLVTSQV